MSYLTGDVWSNLIEFRTTNDAMKVVLEIAPESGKTTTDSEPCTLRNLLHEMEETGMVDVKLKGHSCDRPGASSEGGPSMPLRHKEHTAALCFY